MIGAPRARLKPILLPLLGLLCFLGVLWAQKPFKQYPALEYDNFPLPPDSRSTHEWTFGRLKYPDPYGPNLYWSMDYPRSDRHVVQGIRRLTRIDTRSVEQVVEADGSDDIYNWPFLYAVEPGHWVLPPREAQQLREYLNRGGFLMADDFHGEVEWAYFAEGMQEILPGAGIDDLRADDPVFHTVYDLNDRVQVPGYRTALQGLTYERPDGKEAHWRGVYDKRGRLQAVMTHNMDLGDAWEHSDDPEYPEKMASVAYRVMINYVTYDLTH